jgi:uncharacterized iron-regulated membrane protein
MTRITNGLWKTSIITHRYLGVAVGLLMAIWFISGIVMMYVGFPQPAGSERLYGLPRIAWADCCRMDVASVSDGQPIGRAEIEMLLGTPALRLPRVLAPVQTIDLTKGNDRHLDIDEAKAVAIEASPRVNEQTPPLLAGEEIDEDQWTLNRYRQEQPIFRFSFGDPQRSVLYVSGASGRVVLHTTAGQRFWNWLGAIPHWLYFESLRTNGLFWSRTVIWTSILGSFLTIVGLYLGIAQFKRGKDRRVSPYRGLFYWHHLAGLVFGLVTLAFVASGLVSMNPWGFLDSRPGNDRARLEGTQPRWEDVKTSILALKARAIMAVNLSLAPYGGQIFWLAAGDDGFVTRLDAAGNLAPISARDLTEAAARLAGSAGTATQGLIHEADAYYIGDRLSGRLPVYRVIANDAESTRYYIDPTSGALLERADSNRRWHRWLFGAIHRLDFAAWIRVRPAWDITLIVLMLGGIAVSATGVYLALRRVRNDLKRLFCSVRRSAQRIARLWRGDASSRQTQPGPGAEGAGV